MPATRTQVYLTEQQRRRIDEIAASSGRTMAEVVREAVDRFLAETADPSQALDTSFGALPDLVVADRDEWDRG